MDEILKQNHTGASRELLEAPFSMFRAVFYVSSRNPSGTQRP